MTFGHVLVDQRWPRPAQKELSEVRLTWKDLVATALVAAIAVPCIDYMVAGSVPFQNPTGWLGSDLLSA